MSRLRPIIEASRPEWDTHEASDVDTALVALLSATFGWHKPHDVHYHPCLVEGCSRVLIGKGRTCRSDSADHWRETL